MDSEQPSRTFDAPDESVIRAVVFEFANTWNRHDMHAMHELDTEDVEWINVSGHHCRAIPKSQSKQKSITYNHLDEQTTRMVGGGRAQV